MDLNAKKWPDASLDDASSYYKAPFSNVVYIENSDFRMKDSKDYYGLAPGKSVLLRYAFPIKCTDVILGDDKETVLEIRAEYDPSKKTNQRGFFIGFRNILLGFRNSLLGFSLAFGFSPLV
ncbi:glutamine--tRNA ligase [Camellia sinensis]|uniref:glutamine--tRNA ligase n=1 Tax=Camellia sinensis TaxID=4442 RepID=UPI001036311F|nr:glutamine--tRNA ligase [Camellia sinensis]